jgi:hypothetical protein
MRFGEFEQGNDSEDPGWRFVKNCSATFSLCMVLSLTIANVYTFVDSYDLRVAARVEGSEAGKLPVCWWSVMSDRLAQNPCRVASLFVSIAHAPLHHLQHPAKSLWITSRS